MKQSRFIAAFVIIYGCRVELAEWNAGKNDKKSEMPIPKAS